LSFHFERSNKDKQGDTITIDDRHPLSYTDDKINTIRQDDDDEKYYATMQSN
jgi:hypothetical protein